MEDPQTVEMIREALRSGVVVDTWLAGAAEEQLDDEAVELLTRAVEELFARYGEPGIGQKILAAHPVSDDFVRAAIGGVLASTALNRAQTRAGSLSVDEALAAEAVEAVRRFVAENGLSGLVRLYALATTYEDLAAIRYYRRLPRADFVSGSCHRPWGDYLLTEELDFLIGLGLVETEAAPSGEVLRVTASGEDCFWLQRRLLEESGEMAWRLQQQRIAQFNRLVDYDALLASWSPEHRQQTEAFLDFAGFRSGERVLEVGCGTGRATLDCGLVRRVGQVVATDPSLGLLRRAEEKARQYGATNVAFRQARAESLPFPDASFDATLGVAFLHFTDAAQAIGEMMRVTRPGGTVAIFTALKNNPFETPVLQRWFRPLLELAGSQGLTVQLEGSTPGEAGRFLSANGAQDVREVPITARCVAWDGELFPYLTVQGIGLFQRALEPLPAVERGHVLTLLQQAGREVCASTGEEERSYLNPMEFVRGTRPL